MLGTLKLDANILASFRCAFVCRPPYIDRDQIRTLRINQKAAIACLPRGINFNGLSIFPRQKKFFLFSAPAI